MTTTLVTGATGYLGGYGLVEMLGAAPERRFVLLVRAKDEADARRKLWQGLQLHLNEAAFLEALKRIELVPADLTAPRLGLGGQVRERLAGEVTRIVHAAASLNRRSETACLNVNQRGTLQLLDFAQSVAKRQQLERFVYVSTVAVAGQRQDVCIREDEPLDFGRRDYDPYARSKKFGETMVATLLAGESIAVLRPSIVMGDSRFAATTQFDMVQAFVAMAELPLLPLDPSVRLDIVNADYVGRAIAALHGAATLPESTFHASAGAAAPTIGSITAALSRALGKRPPRCVAPLAQPTGRLVDAANALLPRRLSPRILRLLNAFWPYLTNNAVFDNHRLAAHFALRPAPFTDYCGDLYRYARRHHFTYPAKPYPAAANVLSLPNPAAGQAQPIASAR